MTAIHCGNRSGHLRLPVLILLLLVVCIRPVMAADYEKKYEKYDVPDVTLVNQDGEKVELQEIVNSGKPVILDFIYGTCTTICPVLSIGFSHFQKKMGEDAQDVHLVSVSIDPDNDTPLVMKEYLERYDARPGWDFLTGKRTDIIQVMKAFDAYVMNKMDHYPITLLHAPGAEEWVRINELLSTSELMQEYEMLQEKNAAPAGS